LKVSSIIEKYKSLEKRNSVLMTALRVRRHCFLYYFTSFLKQNFWEKLKSFALSGKAEHQRVSLTQIDLSDIQIQGIN